jgi:uncharacterized protein YkwD
MLLPGIDNEGHACEPCVSNLMEERRMSGIKKCFLTATLAVLFTTDTTFTHAAARQNNSSVRLTRHERQLVDAVNEYRDDRGLPPLSVDPVLMRVARRSAPHFSHCIHGKWCWHRAREAGFSGWATDNIADGYPTPEDAVQGWATSPGHARQMRGGFKMNGRWRDYRFNRIGVGVCGRRYIAVFGRDDSFKERNGPERGDG